MDILEQILNPIPGPAKGCEMDVEARDIEPGDMLLVPVLIERPEAFSGWGRVVATLREQDRVAVTLLSLEGQRVRLKGWADDMVRIERNGPRRPQ
jgi:hypothetical protein